jgi:hypothetical protein
MVIGAILCSMAVVGISTACTGSPQPPPTTTRSTSTPSPSRSPTAQQLRCLAEGTFVVDVGTELGRIVMTEGSDPGHSDEEQAMAAAGLQLERLLARPVHEPFIAARAKLIAGANKIVEGNRILLGPGHHDAKRTAYLEVSAGGNEAITTAADAKVKRASCVP